MSVNHLNTHPIHLGLGASARVQPEFTGQMQWYQDYAERNAADGFEGRLVTSHTFSEPWSMWEMHPNGSEVVVCLAGRITLLQEQPDGSIVQACLAPGDYAINQPGIWHTADVTDSATALFITAGAGTEHRGR